MHRYNSLETLIQPPCAKKRNLKHLILRKFRPILLVLNTLDTLWIPVQEFLGIIPSLQYHLRFRWIPFYHLILEGDRTADNSLCDCLGGHRDGLAVLVQCVLEAEGPEHVGDSEEQGAFSDIQTRADTTTGSELDYGQYFTFSIGRSTFRVSAIYLITHREMVALIRIRERSAFLSTEEVILVAVRVKVTRVRISLWVVVQGPDIDHDASLSGEFISVVFVVVSRSMRDDSEDTRRQETERFFNDTANVLEV